MDQLVWAERLEELKRGWAALQPRDDFPVVSWSQRMAAMSAQVADLRLRGLWSRGPTDLMTICRVHRRELVQSAALAWVCDPEARHGLGDRLLTSLLETTGDTPEITPPVLVDLEVSRSRSRADVVIRTATWTLVIEVKVDAPEGDEQCQRLYDDWRDDPDPRFIFLTRRGSAPTTADTDDARLAWTRVSWRDIFRMLRDATAVADPTPAGRVALDEWMRTLKRLYGRGLP